MMKTKILLFYLLTILPFPVCAQSAALADEVNMFMGVRGGSNCVIGPQLPHGSVNPAPQTPKGGQNGYDEHDVIRGFGQLHVSGIGWSRYGQLLLSPQTGFSAKEDGHDSQKSEEVATPYYYKVRLNRYDILTELAPTHHAVAYRLTYPDKKNKTLLLDMRHSIPQHIVPIVKGRFLGGQLDYNAERHLLTGWGEYAGGFGSEQPYKVYFALQLDDADVKVAITNRGTKELYARMDISRPVVNAAIAVSLRSIKDAEKYLRLEIGNKTVDNIKVAAREAWNEALGKIQVKGATPHERQLFYTALYHSLVMPRDRTADNPHWQSTQAHIDDHYCIWDTWRTCYPLLTLINESFVAKTVNSFIDRLAHDGKCTPTFTASMEWDSKQGGDDVDNVIADAILKNVKGFDRRKAYEVMRHNALHARDTAYQRYGYIPGEHQMMSCSYTMEYAYNDDCCARIARLMGDDALADNMERRSQQWTQLFNSDLESHGFKGFIAPKRADGSWITIDPAHVYGSWVDYFYEGNSWCYTLFTPAQTDRLISLCGGKQQMVRRLQYGFDHGLIDLSNEPGFLTPFLFTHCDRPDLTADYVTRLRQTGFSIERGYPDNEDSGAMGSWYVFTSIGLFPNAGQDYYYLLPPTFDEVTLTMENKKQIRMVTRKSSPDARYISRVTLNGKVLDRAWIRHAEIAEGATIVYELTEQPGALLGGFAAQKPQPFGVNLAGAEFYHKKMEGAGRFNKDYHYPTTRELDYWASKDMMLIRLPFKWERLQRDVEGPLSSDELEYIRFLLREADRRGMSILLDMHNYGRRNYMGKNRIIGDTLQSAHFAQAWATIARALKDEPGLYGYGLCNEPHDMLDSCPWVEIAQVAIDSIRSVDRQTAIVVAGNTWSSAERWPYINQGLETLRDPSDNLIYEAHCYFDSDASGIYRKGYDEEEAYPTVGVDRVRPFVEWLKRYHKRGLVGEYGVPADDARWLECLDLFLGYLADNGVQGTYWAAGARWGKYILSVHPEQDYTVDRPQVNIMTKYKTTR
jgi:predicted alpha-1,2-mannosidase